MLNVGSGNSPFFVLKVIRGMTAFALVVACEDSATAAPTQVLLDPDSATTIVTRDSDFTYRMTDGVQFICDLYFPPYLPPYLAPPLSSPCDIQAGVITPPVYIRSIASDGGNRYGGGINVSMFSSKYNGRILSTTFTVSLSAPATGYIGYADQVGTNFHNFITVPLDLAPGTQQLTFTAPPGMSLHSMYMGYLDGQVNAPQISLRDISLMVAPKNSISVAEAHFWQVIKDPQPFSQQGSNSFDAVLGKSSNFSITLQGSGLPTTGSITLVAQDPTGNSTTSQPINMSDFSAGGSFTVGPNMWLSSYVPQSLGNLPITVKIVPSPGTNIGSSSKTVMSLNVYQTNTPRIALVAVTQDPLWLVKCSALQNPNQSGCIGNVQNSDIANMSIAAQPMSEMYPVSNDSIILGSVLNTSSLKPVFGSTSPTSLASGTKWGFTDDTLALKQYLSKIPFAYNRIVGIVSPTYFQNRGFGEMAGIFPPDIAGGPDVVFAVDNDPSTILHELAHSLGQSSEGYCDPAHSSITTCQAGASINSYDGTQVRGFDATTNSFYLFPSLNLPFPANSILAESIMGTSNRIRQQWMDNDTYLKIFKTLTHPIVDPDVLVVSGILSSSGQFSFSSSYELPNGTLTPSENTGDLTVSLLDTNNSLVNSVSVKTNFVAIGRPLNGLSSSTVFQLDSIPILLQLPNSAAAETIQVSANSGEVISKTSFNGQIAQGAIADIPDNAFKSQVRNNDRDHEHANGKQEYRIATPVEIAKDRSTLFDRITEIQKILNSKHKKEAIHLLKELIEEVERLTFDNYEITSTAELTQAQVISSIEKIIYKIENEKNSHGSKDSEIRDDRQ